MSGESDFFGALDAVAADILPQSMTAGGKEQKRSVEEGKEAVASAKTANKAALNHSGSDSEVQRLAALAEQSSQYGDGLQIKAGDPPGLKAEDFDEEGNPKKKTPAVPTKEATKKKELDDLLSDDDDDASETPTAIKLAKEADSGLTPEEKLFTAFGVQLAQAGILEDIDDTFDPSSTGLKTQVEKTINKRVEDAVTEYKTKLGEESPIALAFIDHVKAGGLVSEFAKVHEGPDWKSYKFEALQDKPEYLATVVGKWYESQGLTDANEIRGLVKAAFDNGTLKAQAKVALTVLQKNQIATETELAEKVKARTEAKLKEEADFNKKLSKTVLESQFPGFNPPMKVRKKLEAYLQAKDGQSEWTKAEASRTEDQKLQARVLHGLLDLFNFDMGLLSKALNAQRADDLTTLLSALNSTSTGKTGGRRETTRKPEADPDAPSTTVDFALIEDALARQ
jgi:hypothetical protein